MDAVYYRLVADGFIARWNPAPRTEAFAQVYRDHLGHGLTLDQSLPQNIRLLGLSTDKTRLSNRSVLLMAQHSDGDVLVIIESEELMGK